MILRSFVLAVIFVIAGRSAALADEYSLDAVAQIVAEAAKASGVIESVVRTGEDTLEITFANGVESSVYLGNLVAELNDEPENEQQTLDQFLSVILSTGAAEQAQQTADRLMPIVRDSDYLNYVQETLAASPSQDDGPVTRPIAGDYWLLVAFDDESAIRLAQRSDLAGLSMTDDELVKRAIANFTEILLPIVEVQQINGVYVLILDGSYEASILAAESFWEKESLRLEDNIVAVAPARDMVLYCKASNDDCIDKIQAFASENIGSLGNAVSDTLLEWAENDWREHSR